MNGPVPTSLVLQSGDFICDSAMMPKRLLPHRNHGNALHGTFVVTVSVRLSTTSTDVTSANTKMKSWLSLR